MSILNSIKRLFSIEKIDYKTIIQNGAILVDVRTPKEFQSEHTKESINIPLQEFSKHIDKFTDNEVVLVCRSGARASKALSILKQHNIKAYNAGAWQNTQ